MKGVSDLLLTPDPHALADCRWLALVVVGLILGVAVATATRRRAHVGRLQRPLALRRRDRSSRTSRRRPAIDIELRGGTGPELFERLRREGDDTPADVLVTTDLANLWRAEEAGLLQQRGHVADARGQRPAAAPRPRRGVGGAQHPRCASRSCPPSGCPRARSPTTTDLGDPQYRGRTCLRTSNNEYNQSFVADLIAKHGLDATRELLESWMANDPQIINSDGELLAVIAAGDCDVGLSNHYYLGRALDEDPDFPVAPAWPDQDGRGAHANVSGVGVVTWSDQPRRTPCALMEYLTSPPAQEEIVAGSEFAANPAVPPAEHIRDWADVKIDPIAVDEAGPLLDDAIALMLEVGWN